MTANDHPNAIAFLKQIANFIVLISARFDDDPNPPTPLGTGFIGGFFRNNSGAIRPIVVTAGHVIEHDRKDRTEWFVSRLKTSTSSEKTARFVTPDARDFGARVRWYAGEWYKPKHSNQVGPSFDLGALVFPNDAADGGFMREDEDVPAANPKNIGLAPGTAVAWAGFPLAASALLGSQFLCYYQGVISTSTLNVEGMPPLYLIDGHNSRGLSGAPVWHCDTVDNRPLIAAVITHYSQLDEGLPGLVHASPVSPLFEMLAQEQAAAALPTPPSS